MLQIYSNRLYNVKFSFVKLCIHFFGGPCIYMNITDSQKILGEGKTSVVLIHKILPKRIFVKWFLLHLKKLRKTPFSYTCCGREQTSSVSVCAHSSPSWCSWKLFKPLIYVCYVVPHTRNLKTCILSTLFTFLIRCSQQLTNTFCTLLLVSWFWSWRRVCWQWRLNWNLKYNSEKFHSLRALKHITFGSEWNILMDVLFLTDGRFKLSFGNEY